MHSHTMPTYVTFHYPPNVLNGTVLSPTRTSQETWEDVGMIYIGAADTTVQQASLLGSWIRMSRRSSLTTHKPPVVKTTRSDAFCIFGIWRGSSTPIRRSRIATSIRTLAILNCHHQGNFVDRMSLDGKVRGFWGPRDSGLWTCRRRMSH
jgi:hypothetical protein